MKTNTRKIVSVAVAAALVAGIALTDSFAWQSVNQEALNETYAQINPGGRLHDDFDGKNKDVYVENFTDKDNGGISIFARVRLDEYMEIGPDAGINRTAEERDVTILGGEDAKIDDVTTWTTHKPVVVPEICIGGTTETFHDYWSWELGGSTWYMPTFNTNKDSMEADINGTLEGLIPGDDEHYDDYIQYTADSDPVKGFEIWDIDDNDADELKSGNISIQDVIAMESEAVAAAEALKDDQGVSNISLNKGTANAEGVAEGVEHLAKETQKGTVITMAQWEALDCPVGDYWVYDTDGWAYWAEPIKPGEATGLLLNGITMDREPNGDCYYAINVVAQFATRGDWGQEDGTGFYDETKGEPPSEKALFLLNRVAGEKPTVTLTGADGSVLPETAAPGSTLQMEAELTLSERVLEEQSVEWSVTGAQPLHADTTIDENGLLSVSTEEDPDNVLIIRAVSVEDPRAWAVVNIPVE